DDAPADEDASEPDAGTELVQREIRGHLEDKVAEEEDPGGKSELVRAHREVLVHPARSGDAEVRAIEVVDEVHRDDEGDEADEDLAQSPLLQRRIGWQLPARGRAHLG